MTKVVESCERCRKLKVRCDKSRPQCQRCISSNMTCEYAQSLPTTPLLPSPAPSSDTSLPRQSRDRAILSCVKCRKHKVKCSRGRPCTRCARLGKECVYHGAPPNLEEIATTFMDVQWEHRSRNSTHWNLLVKNIQHLLPCLSSQPHLDAPSVSISINYPLSSSRNSTPLELPTFQIQRQYVEHFHNTINDMYRILPSTYPSTFSLSLMSNESLALFYTVLSLGCQAHNFVSYKTEHEALASDLLTAAETHLHRTPFLLRPTTDTIRTLCLMVIAKQIYAMSCHQSDTCWHLTGLALRMSISINLGKTDPDVWALVCLLDMRQSLACGMPLLLRRDDISHFWDSNAPRDTLLQETFFTVGESIFSALQLASSTPTPPQVLELDTALRQQPRTTSSLEAIGIDIFLRQVLLALHASCTAYPISHLESALSLLSHQRTLCEDDESRQSCWLAGFFRHEFFTAAMTVCVHLVQGTGDNDPHARSIMVDALRSCRNIWARETCASVCNASAFAIVDKLVNDLGQ